MNTFDDILEPISKSPDLSVVPMKKNYVVISLDRSGSMSLLRKEAIEFFNSQVIEAQNASEQENRICLLTFADNAKVEMWDVGAHEVELLDEKSYIPDGWTAMLDSVGLGISKLLQQPDINEEHVSVLFIVISDGGENHSKEYNSESISKMIKEVNATNRWSFVYLGANQDLANIKKMGISENNMMSFTACGQSMNKITNDTRLASSTFYNSRTMGMTNTSGFYDDESKPTTASNNKNRKTNKTT
jgi:hypothetical protein